MVGCISLFLTGKTAKYLDQIDLFWFVDPSKFRFPTSLQQTLQWRIALAELREAGTLPGLFLVEEQSIWILLDIMSKPDGCKNAPDIDFHHRLFEVVIDLE
jgi:hypothetical protein